MNGITGITDICGAVVLILSGGYIPLYAYRFRKGVERLGR